MADWLSDYNIPMDRSYHASMPEYAIPQYHSIEDPIFPLQDIGITVPENDATGRNKNMLQGIQANIRRGTGTMQIVMQTDPNAAIGGRFKAYGKEVRQSMREVIEATGIHLQGVELPTSLNNMSGFDQRQGKFSDEQQHKNVQELKDAIHFVADVAGGGGVDNVSFEFDRTMSDAKWNEVVTPGNKKKETEYLFTRGPEAEEAVSFVDKETGQLQQIPKNRTMFLPYEVPTTGKAAAKISDKLLSGKFHEKDFKPDEEGLPKLHKWHWQDIKKFSELATQGSGKKVNPEKAMLRFFLQNQIDSAKGQASYYIDLLNREKAELDLIDSDEYARKFRERNGRDLTEADKKDQKDNIHRQIRHHQQAAITYTEQAKQQEERLNNFTPVEEYAIERTKKGYAELGVEAWRVTKQNPHVKNPIHVGPEIGWPQFYGGHPDEFIEIVKGARKKMVKELMDKEKMRESEAKKAAETHISGMFDTSHLGMWLDHFHRELPWDQRVKKFEKWYLEQVKKLAKSGVVGDMQLVDAIGGQHSHLPPGEGILPLRETLKIFKKGKKFHGKIISEGHEEEKFGEGRIQFGAWKTAGATIGEGYRGAAPIAFSPMHNNYFGAGYSAMYMVGSYVPSNEFKLWTEVPFE